MRGSPSWYKWCKFNGMHIRTKWILSWTTTRSHTAQHFCSAHIFLPYSISCWLCIMYEDCCRRYSLLLLWVLLRCAWWKLYKDWKRGGCHTCFLAKSFHFPVCNRFEMFDNLCEWLEVNSHHSEQTSHSMNCIA